MILKKYRAGRFLKCEIYPIQERDDFKNTQRKSPAQILSEAYIRYERIRSKKTTGYIQLSSRFLSLCQRLHRKSK